ncbi:MAG: SURF1 family protein [Actinomycetota bacterium]
MWSLLRTRRWLAFTALVLAAIVAFGLLSRWQWSRAEERRSDRIELQSETAENPVTWDAAMADPAQWRPVTLTGTYDDAATRLIRQRPLDGRNGFWVATPLQEGDGTRIWVNRGWVAIEGGATATQAAPAAPAGQVTVVGWLRESESMPSPAPTDLPAGQSAALDPASLDAGSAPDFYVQASESTPSDPAVTIVPVPVIDEGRNISYAIQWLLFAAVAIAGWLFFLRREARDDAQRAAREAEGVPWTSA